MQLPIYEKDFEIMEEAERFFDILPLSDETENSAKKWDSFCLAQTLKRARSRQKQISRDAPRCGGWRSIATKPGTQGANNG